MLQIDVSHRVLRTETVLDYLKQLMKRLDQNPNFDVKKEAEKTLLGNKDR